MAATASRFFKFMLIHGLPFGFMLSTIMLGGRFLFYWWEGNAAGIGEAIELIPTYLIMAVAAGIFRGVMLWVFRREDYGY